MVESGNEASAQTCMCIYDVYVCNHWWLCSCILQMSKAIENAFYVESYNFGRDPNVTTFSGAVSCP